MAFTQQEIDAAMAADPQYQAWLASRPTQASRDAQIAALQQQVAGLQPLIGINDNATDSAYQLQQQIAQLQSSPIDTTSYDYSNPGFALGNGRAYKGWAVGTPDAMDRFVYSTNGQTPQALMSNNQTLNTFKPGEEISQYRPYYADDDSSNFLTQHWWAPLVTVAAMAAGGEALAGAGGGAGAAGAAEGAGIGGTSAEGLAAADAAGGMSSAYGTNAAYAAGLGGGDAAASAAYLADADAAGGLLPQYGSNSAYNAAVGSSGDWLSKAQSLGKLLSSAMPKGGSAAPSGSVGGFGGAGLPNTSPQVSAVDLMPKFSSAPIAQTGYFDELGNSQNTLKLAQALRNGGKLYGNS